MSVKSSIQSRYPSQDVVDKYISDVLDGVIPTCKYTQLAVQRHLNDLETAAERGLYFDPAAAQRAIDFSQLLKHSKGEWAGQYLRLEPWQQFIVWVLYGWKKSDGKRRYRTAYNEVARKNGKTTFMAALALYGMGFDDESGAEIYSVATKEAQAMLSFEEGQRMVQKSGYLGGMAKVHKKAISIDRTNSFWKPRGRDSKTEDGLNPHYVLVDEYHAHVDSSMLDVMDSAIGARTQPLVLIITTAGFNINSACYIERDYAIKVLKGEVVDDSYFAIIYSLDRDEASGELLDDWKDPACWIKANPNLGVSVKIQDMERMRDQAVESPTKLNNFLVKKLNVWTTQETKFFNMEKWAACTDIVTEEELLGSRCWLGVDLASKSDITAIVRLFKLQDGRVVLLPKFFCPREGAEVRSKTDRVPYLLWAEKGYLTLTPGSRTDYAFIQESIQSDWSKFDVVQMGFDKWNFEFLYQNLVTDGMDTARIIEYGQTLQYMSEPTKELESLVLSGKLVHNGNPILAWMAANTAIYTDPNGNIRPLKNKSSEKIDGIIAAVIALGLSLVEKEIVDNEANLLEVGI